jgi:hypothetical protein
MSRALARCLDVGWMLSPSVRVGVASRDSTHATRDSRVANRDSGGLLGNLRLDG